MWELINMARPQPQFSEQEKQEILTGLKNHQRPSIYKRLTVLKLKAVDGMKSEDVGKVVNLHKETVNKIVSRYKKGGMAAIVPIKTNSNRRYLSEADEQNFLEPFVEKANNGQMLEVSEIATALKEKIGHYVCLTTVYLLLKRNNWRKVMPRSKHPKKASDEAIEAYKKNL